MNSIFKNFNEQPISTEIECLNKIAKRIVGVKQIASSKYCGHITRKNKVTAMYIWDVEKQYPYVINNNGIVVDENLLRISKKIILKALIDFTTQKGNKDNNSIA